MNTTTASDVGMRIARRLADHLGPRRYAMWFDQSAQLDFDDAPASDDDETQNGELDGAAAAGAAAGTLRVAVPNQFVADWIGRHFDGALREAAQQELGQRVALDVRVAPERFPQPGGPSSAATGAGTAPDTGAEGQTGAETGAEAGAAEAQAGLRPPRAPGRSVRKRTPDSRTTRLRGLRHDLAEFIVGPSNQLAFAAAQRLADDEAEAGSPLFIHGGCGLGKTHLLQGICRRVLEHQPEAHVLYTTGEQFTNEYITAVRTNKLERFRKWIRGLDLLAVDDIHFIANKQATQQEFLHSFDQIELCGARIVLASDSHPKLIEQFSEALVSRCVRGLVVPIKPPDGQTRARLVHALAERRELHLSAPATRVLGQQCHGSVRDIEGALTKLQALVTLARQNGQRVAEPLGPAFVHQLLESDAGPGSRNTPRTPIRFETILEAVTEELGVGAQQVLGRGRHRMVVLARSLTVHLARQLTSMSYPEIAKALGRANHSTVITAAQRIASQLESEQSPALPAHLDGETLGELVDRLSSQIKRREPS